MPGPLNTLLIEGSFEELADELAHYIDDVKKKPSEDGSGVQAEIAPLLEQGQKDEALKKIVTGSSILNLAPEKGIFSNLNGPVRPRICKGFLPRCRIHSSLQSPRSPCPPITQP